MSETLMQDNAATTTEGSTASQTPSDNAATAAKLYGDQQQATDGQTTQAQDGATDGQTEGGKDGATEGDKPADGAPEKYEFKSQAGEEFDAEVVNAYSEVAKELNLSQDAAQKVLDKVAPVMQARAAQQIEALRNGWAESAKADKEFGGEKLTENLAVAKKALDQFGSPELSKLLNESGLGNHPEIIRAFFKAGKAISEDRYVGGDQGRGGKTGPKEFGDLASALYSNQQH